MMVPNMGYLLQPFVFLALDYISSKANDKLERITYHAYNHKETEQPRCMHACAHTHTHTHMRAHTHTLTSWKKCHMLAFYTWLKNHNCK